MSEEYKHAAEELITEKMERTFESGKAHVLVPYAQLIFATANTF